MDREQVMMLGLLTFLKSNYKIILVIILLAAVYMWGHHSGAVAVQDKWDKEKVAQEAAIVKAENDALKTERLGSNSTNEVSNEVQKRFNDIRNSYDSDINGLQPGTAYSNTVPKAAGTARAGDATTCRAELPQQSKRRILKLMELADLQTAQLAACQDWINRQEAIYR